jgi:lysine-specific demethylase 8
MAEHRICIDRISTPSADAFESDYMIPQRPVVLTDLFAGQALGKLASRDDVCEVLADTKIMVREEYTRSLLANSFQLPSQEPQVLSIGQYFEYVDANPDTRLLCSEFHSPGEVRNLFEFPDYCQLQGLPDDAISMLFLGNAGNYAHLHFDGDYRQVLLYQVFGQKRIILIPTTEGNKLLPVGNFSLTSFENFTETEIAEFLHYVKGFQCTLNPGEAIFMPAGFWHFVGYLTTGMSVNVRFGRNEFTQFLGDKCHANCYLQNIAARMADRQAVEQSELHDQFREIQRVYNLPFQTSIEKGRQLESVCQQICLQLNSDFARKSHIQLPSPVPDGLLQIVSDQFYPAPRLNLSGWKQLV